MWFLRLLTAVNLFSFLEVLVTGWLGGLARSDQTGISEPTFGVTCR